MKTADLSIIIPVGRGDESWRSLLMDLVTAQADSEIFLVGATAAPPDLPKAAKWLCSEPGRARQLNVGAAHASGKLLWFLHADSRLCRRTLDALMKSVIQAPAALHYFDLKFSANRGLLSWMMRLNEFGVRLRSRVFQIPFGDQGFCLSVSSFKKIGIFPEAAAYGEDHLWVWQAHCRGVALKPVHAQLLTSARKYERDGWFFTTARHLGLTVRQCVPELYRLLKAKGFR
jgi:hypothetical protein